MPPFEWKSFAASVTPTWKAICVVKYIPARGRDNRDNLAFLAKAPRVKKTSLTFTEFPALGLEGVSPYLPNSHSYMIVTSAVVWFNAFNHQGILNKGIFNHIP